MRPSATLLLLAALLLPALTQARVLGKVRVAGIEGEPLENVRKSLSLLRLNEADRDALEEPRLAYLLRRVPAEVSRALEPYGYYEATAEVAVKRRNGTASVTITIDPGKPVRVEAVELSIQGAADADSAVTQALAAFPLHEGEVLDHAAYDSGKLAIQRTLPSGSRRRSS